MSVSQKTQLKITNYVTAIEVLKQLSGQFFIMPVKKI